MCSVRFDAPLPHSPQRLSICSHCYSNRYTIRYGRSRFLFTFLFASLFRQRYPKFGRCSAHSARSNHYRLFESVWLPKIVLHANYTQTSQTWAHALTDIRIGCGRKKRTKLFCPFIRVARTMPGLVVIRASEKFVVELQVIRRCSYVGWWCKSFSWREGEELQ